VRVLTSMVQEMGLEPTRA